MFPFLHLRTAVKSAAALQAVITVGAVAGAAAWAVSLDKSKDAHDAVTASVVQEARNSTSEESEFFPYAASPETTLYIVTSEELAAVLRFGFADSAVLQWHLEMPPRRDEVALVSDRAEALRRAVALTDATSVMATGGMQGFEVVVVDKQAGP